MVFSLLFPSDLAEPHRSGPALGVPYQPLGFGFFFFFFIHDPIGSTEFADLGRWEEVRAE